jgi:nucleoside-diphosphate-sugar epimerase
VKRLLIFGLGYSGAAVARAALLAGWEVAATTRDGSAPVAGVRMVVFDAAEAAVGWATHALACAPPGDSDPVLARYANAIRTAPALRWIGYLSSTVVYGDRGGGWVNEATPPAPSQPRGERRLAAEGAWSALGEWAAVDVFRLAGIYGPGRSAFDDLRAGRSRRMIKPGHCFGRIHRDDIASAVMAALDTDRRTGARVLNVTDDEPAESATVVTEAAKLLGMPPPPAIRFEDAWPTMSPMARSFWAENRKVSAATTKAALGIAWRYPTYREGLRAVLAEERQSMMTRDGT